MSIILVLEEPWVMTPVLKVYDSNARHSMEKAKELSNMKVTRVNGRTGQEGSGVRRIIT